MRAEQLIISLSPKLARFIRAKVKSGKYANASEVVVDAVRKMQAAEDAATPQLVGAELEEVRRLVQEGVAQLESGEYEAFDAEGLRAFFEDVNARGRQRFEASSRLHKASPSGTKVAQY